MGRGDNRRGRKTVQRRSQAKKKAAAKRVALATKKKRLESKVKTKSTAAVSA